MKLINKIWVLAAVVLLVSACKKDKENTQNPDGTIDIQKITLQTIEPVFRSDQSVRTGGKTSIDLSKHSYLEYGICFGEDPSPTINDDIVSSTVSSNGEYESVIDKKYLKEEKALYIRAFIKDLNKNITRYGNEVSITPDSLDNETSDSRFLSGVFAGKHFLNIPTTILEALSELLPPDEDGNLVNLAEGLADTLTIKMNVSSVEVYSSMMKSTFTGNITGSNRFRIIEKQFTSLSFGALGLVQNAKIKSAEDIHINSGNIGVIAPVKLTLSANIPEFPTEVVILTTGNFVKIK